MTSAVSCPSPDALPTGVRRLRPVLVLALLLALAVMNEPVAAKAGACDAPAPPPAAAAGYTKLLFCDDFADPGTIDLEAAGCPPAGPCPDREARGFKWFRAGKPFAYEQTPKAGVAVTDGVLTLDDSSKANLAILTTYARQGGGFGGFTVKSRGAYFEAALAFEVPPQSWIEQNNPWYAPWRRGQALWRTGWPSFWSMDACYLYGRCSPFMELDFFEYLSYPFAGLDSYTGAVHRWVDLELLGQACARTAAGPPELPRCHQKQQSNNFTGWDKGYLGERGIRRNALIEVPAGTDWSGRFNAVGMLLKRGESLDFYFADRLHTRNSYAEYPWLALADQGEFPVILGSKDWPMRVEWVRVWGAPE
jgi:hypothetical protein